jgi:peptidyl-prolyl cis-trans isomerase D
MFDLFRSRDKAVRILLGAMLLLVALSMLTYLIPNYDTGSSANDQVVARVGKEDIMLTDVQKVVQGTLRQRQLPAEIIPNYIPTMVEQMITERAMAYEAQRLGYTVTDQDVRDTIRQTIPNLFPDGNFVGKDAYAAMLAQNNLTIPEFESDLRRQILVTRLRNIAIEGTVVSQPEIEAEYKKKYEKVKVAWVGAGEEESRDPDSRSGQNGSSDRSHGRPTPDAVQPEQGPIPHAGAREGTPYSAEDYR